MSVLILDVTDESSIAMLVTVHQKTDRQVFILSGVVGCGALDSGRHIWVHSNVSGSR